MPHVCACVCKSINSNPNGNIVGLNVSDLSNRQKSVNMGLKMQHFIWVMSVPTQSSCGLQQHYVL